MYGEGTLAGLTGIVPDNTNFKFGAVSQVWGYGSWLYGHLGQSAMFEEKNVECRLSYANWPYTLINEADVLIVEVTPP